MISLGLISIIIPVFNRAKYLKECLESVLCQDYVHWECIIVDDGSTDRSIEIINTYISKDSRFQLYCRSSDYKKGANSCRNIGLECSNGEYVYFFDSDDIMLADALRNAINSLVQSKSSDLAFFNYQVFFRHKSNIIINQNNKTENPNPFLSYFSGEINLATPAILWKRSTIGDVRFNPCLKKSQELDFHFQVFKSNPKISMLFVNQIGFLVRKHEDSIVGNYFGGNFKSLLSELYVRNQLFDYFQKHDCNSCSTYNQKALKSCLFTLMTTSHFFRFLWILSTLYVDGRKYFDFPLIVYKMVKVLSKRDYRFNQRLKLLSERKVEVNFKLC
ncbi:glycosyltransferase family 2 protein [Croceiramulus getboli]|nr:glycosyltransferase family 2 protein [Flavobacteriaceae bacterium YJPT1-3]